MGLMYPVHITNLLLTIKYPFNKVTAVIEFLQTGIRDRSWSWETERSGRFWEKLGGGSIYSFLRQIFLFAHYLLFHTLTPQNRTDGGEGIPNTTFSINDLFNAEKREVDGGVGVDGSPSWAGGNAPWKIWPGGQKSTPWSRRNRKWGSPRQLQPCDHVLLFRIFDSYHGSVAFMSAFMAFISVAFFPS